MRKSFTWGKGSGSSVRLPPQPVNDKPAGVSRQENAIYRAMGVLAAVIEEPYCVLPARELRECVRAWRLLSLAVGIRCDYVYRDGAVFSAAGGQPLKVAPDAPIAPAQSAA